MHTQVGSRTPSKMQGVLEIAVVKHFCAHEGIGSSWANAVNDRVRKMRGFIIQIALEQGKDCEGLCLNFAQGEEKRRTKSQRTTRIVTIFTYALRSISCASSQRVRACADDPQQGKIDA